MAIRRYAGETIRPGEWVNTDGLLRVGFAASAAKVVSVKPQSLVIQPVRRRRDGVLDVDREMIVRTKRVQFVSDSLDEAEKVFEASRKFAEEELRREREFDAETKRLRGIAVNALIEGGGGDAEQALA